VSFHGWQPKAELPRFYGAADVLVFPSRSEPLGRVMLEAMACGTPVVTSNTSSLPEVVGDAGLTVEPLDVRGFASALNRLLTDEALHQSCRERGRMRARQFTWERAARAHLELYQSLVAGSYA
jgi:glycosyltransferase involved in cell wall biosynthesis